MSLIYETDKGKYIIPLTTEFISFPVCILPSDDDFLRIIVPAISDEDRRWEAEIFEEEKEDNEVLENDDDLDEDTDEDFDDDSSDDDEKDEDEE